MPIQTANAVPEDPLQDYSGLSLFARTFSSLPNPPRSKDPDDLNFSHNFLKSMHIQSSTRLLEQAKEIVDSSSKLMDNELQSNAATGNEAFDPERERRPDLGRNKRARFSLKPKSSQPSVNLLPPPDVKKFKDPEDFFSAFEKHKNANRELQKQAGSVLTDWNLNDVDMNERPRRQGTQGRRSVKYTHHTYNSISSQEDCEKEFPIPSIPSSQKEICSTNVDLDETGETHLAGTVAEAENRVNQLLDDLLAENYEQLDGDGAVTLLQQRLQIKPIYLEKLDLLDMQDIQSIDLKDFGENLPKPRDSLSDPLLLDLIDRSPARNASPTKMVHKESDQVQQERFPSMSQLSQQSDFAMAKENVTEVASASLEQNSRYFTGLSDNLVIDERKSLGSVINLGLVESNTGNEDNVAVSCRAKQQHGQIGTGEEVPGRSHQLESAIGEENASDVANATFEVERDFTGPSNNLVNTRLSGSNVSNGDDIGLSSIVNKHRDQAGTEKEVLSSSHLFESSVAEANATEAATASFEVEREDFAEPSDSVVSNLSGLNPSTNNDNEISNNVNEHFDKFETGKEILGMSRHLESPVLEENVTSVAKANSDHSKEDISSPSIFVNDNPSNLCSSIGFGLNGSNASKEDIVEGMRDVENVNLEPTVVVRALESDDMDCTEVAASSQSQINMQDSNVDKLNCNQRVLDDMNTATVTDHAMDDSSEVAERSLKSRKEKVSKVKSSPVNKQRVTRPRKELKKKEAPRRQSLAACGTIVSENGVRRSTRMRSRPLEYWKGERFLYGRIHDNSLATVIGIKYESPGKTGEAPKLKVKSFVPKKYKALVEVAARF